MATVTQRLAEAHEARGAATVVLRSGKTITGPVERVDLHDGVVVVDGWSIRADEVAGFRLG